LVIDVFLMAEMMANRLVDFLSESVDGTTTESESLMLTW